MFDLKTEWSISFAGCGFMGIYYIGATSCILERFPRLIQDASKIYGASAGALMTAILTVGFSVEKNCADLMSMAKEARKHKLGPLHPAFNLIKIVHDSLLQNLPEDAHVRASGKLCISLTRVSDRKNVLVSEFETRDELIQALVCSCFIPFYCGVIPPTYRGVHYIDGAISNNLPHCHLKNTITFSAFTGESDICPRASTLNFHEVRFNNVSIQVDTDNIFRVTSSFFPPEPETMAEICQSGYIDALRFLQENGFISRECPSTSLEVDNHRLACCELVSDSPKTEEMDSRANPLHNGPNPIQRQHWWLDPYVIQDLPVNIKKVLCEACRERHAGGSLLSQVIEFLPVKVASYLQVPCTLPVASASSLAQRLVGWIPDVSRDMSWLYDMAGDLYKQVWKDEAEDYDIGPPLRRCTSLPSGLDLRNWGEVEMNIHPLTPEATSSNSYTFPWETGDNAQQLDHLPLTPPPTPISKPRAGFGEEAFLSPPSTGVEVFVEEPGL
ncbi:patatin-like phospholipase domain-containing protein 2 [Lampris incognitus]|uniref:patatin-like phospholipase domain-containing protein 2 n=1 Tax=Lampris incognitus TaxID=2546036 RepID=UPI0024B590C7|nr:patatin-like phospholipase domain-containing protein 2 [Lampris incognitus]